jgi:hypothetical protein
MPDGFFFFERSSRKLKPFSSLSSREQRRQVAGYLRSNPEVTEQQARKNLSSARRRGRIVRTGTQSPSSEQAVRSEQYRQRSERAREAARKRTGVGGGFDNRPIRVFAYEFGPGVSDVYNLSKADRSIVGRYWNALKKYLEIGMEWSITLPGGKTYLGIRDFDNMPIGNGTLHLVGDPNLIDSLAISDQLDFENIYPQASNPAGSMAA